LPAFARGKARKKVVWERFGKEACRGCSGLFGAKQQFHADGEQRGGRRADGCQRGDMRQYGRCRRVKPGRCQRNRVKMRGEKSLPQHAQKRGHGFHGPGHARKQEHGIRGEHGDQQRRQVGGEKRADKKTGRDCGTKERRDERGKKQDVSREGNVPEVILHGEKRQGINGVEQEIRQSPADVARDPADVHAGKRLLPFLRLGRGHRGSHEKALLQDEQEDGRNDEVAVAFQGVCEAFGAKYQRIRQRLGPGAGKTRGRKRAHAYVISHSEHRVAQAFAYVDGDHEAGRVDVRSYHGAFSVCEIKRKSLWNDHDSLRLARLQGAPRLVEIGRHARHHDLLGGVERAEKRPRRRAAVEIHRRHRHVGFEFVDVQVIIKERITDGRDEDDEQHRRVPQEERDLAFARPQYATHGTPLQKIAGGRCRGDAGFWAAGRGESRRIRPARRMPRETRRSWRTGR